MIKNEDEVLVLSDLLPKKMTKEEENAVKEETKTLFQQYQKGDTKVRNKIVLLNLGLVYAKVSNWMRTRTLTGQELFTKEDLIQDCFVKLIECVDQYDLKQAAFSTYVYGQLTKELRHQFEQYSMNTFTSRYLYQTNQKIRSCINQYQELYGKNPSLDEIARELKITKVAVLSAYEGGQVSQSFQQPIYPGDCQDCPDELGDVVESRAYERMIRKTELTNLRNLLSTNFQTQLTEQEKERVSLVLSHWDGVGNFSFRKLEKTYGYGHNCIGQSFRKAMRKLGASSTFYEQVRDYLPGITKGQKRL